jgi:2-polyprenyl-6-methoxyphenol hydroxylase-like FAD-dependent oxidoreductase
MQDAVILANCLYDLKDNSQASIAAAFKSYRSQRWNHAKEQYDNSKFLAKVVGGLSWSERLIRSIVLSICPSGLWKRAT